LVLQILRQWVLGKGRKASTSSRGWGRAAGGFGVGEAFREAVMDTAALW
jgi:hypothetical protein